MKIRIIFTSPIDATTQSIQSQDTKQSPDANEKLIVIQDPYVITVKDEGRQIVGRNQSEITYENYCIELQEVIDNTIRNQQLDKEHCEAIIIEDCKEPPNFEALQRSLAATSLYFQSPCQLKIKNCSFGGALYVNAICRFVQSAEKHGQNAVFFNLILEEVSDKSRLSEHDKAKLKAIKNIALEEHPTPISRVKITPLSPNRQVIETTQPGSKDDVGTSKKIPHSSSRPSYFFKGEMEQHGSSKSVLMHFFSQVHQQRNDYTCGPAALKMVADFYTAMQKRKFCGEPVSNNPVKIAKPNGKMVITTSWDALNTMPEMAVAEQVNTTETEGSEIADMRDGLMKLRIPVIDDNDGMLTNENDETGLKKHKECLWEKLQAILQLGIPIIINMRNYQNIGHYEVAIGIDAKNNIIFAEPGRALDGKLEFEVLPKDQFIERWKNMDGVHHGRFLIPLPNATSLKQVESILQDVSYYCNGEKKHPNEKSMGSDLSF